MDSSSLPVQSLSLMFGRVSLGLELNTVLTIPCLLHRNMMHNEAEYPNPGNYLPERHLNENGKINKLVRDPMSIAFGFGRR